MCLFIITFPTTTTQRSYELGGNQFAPIHVHENKGFNTLKNVWQNTIHVHMIMHIYN